MEIKNLVLLSPEFLKAFNKIMSVEMTIDQCVEMAEVLQELEKRADILNKAKKALVSKYVIMDESGEPKIEGKQIIFKDEKSKIACELELNKLYDEKFEITIKRKVKVPKSFKMSSQHYFLVKDFVEISEA